MSNFLHFVDGEIFQIQCVGHPWTGEYWIADETGTDSTIKHGKLPNNPTEEKIKETCFRIHFLPNQQLALESERYPGNYVFSRRADAPKDYYTEEFILGLQPADLSRLDSKFKFGLNTPMSANHDDHYEIFSLVQRGNHPVAPLVTGIGMHVTVGTHNEDHKKTFDFKGIPVGGPFIHGQVYRIQGYRIDSSNDFSNYYWQVSDPDEIMQFNKFETPPADDDLSVQFKANIQNHQVAFESMSHPGHYVYCYRDGANVMRIIQLGSQNFQSANPPENDPSALGTGYYFKEILGGTYLAPRNNHYFSLKMHVWDVANQPGKIYLESHNAQSLGLKPQNERVAKSTFRSERVKA